MLRSLDSSVSGMRNHQTQLDVISNNIANVNTIGYKSSRLSFEAAMNQMLQPATRPLDTKGGLNPVQIGMGLSVGSVGSMMMQGNLTTTGKVTDIAIEGDSFFAVASGDAIYYTRDGGFNIDANGNVVLGTNGFVLQGRMADETGLVVPGTPMSGINIPFNAQAPANATTEVSIVRNLDMDSQALGTVLHTQRFLGVARDGSGTGIRAENDSLVSLFNANGQDLGIRSGDRLTVTGQIVDPTTGALISDINLRFDVAGLGEINPPTTLSELQSHIQQAITNAGGAATVGLTADGQISVDNNGSGIIRNLQLSSDGLYSRSMVANTLRFPVVIDQAGGTNEVGLSRALRRPATENDTISSLYTANGAVLGFDGNDIITIGGSVGGTNIEQPVNLYVGIGNFGGNKVALGTSTASVTAGSRTVTSPGGNFVQSGVSVGDVIRFDVGGPNQASFVVERVVSETELIINRSPEFSAGAASFEIGGATMGDLMLAVREAFSLPEIDDTGRPTVSLSGPDLNRIPEGSMVMRGLAGRAFELGNIRMNGLSRTDNSETTPILFNANSSLTQHQIARDHGQYDTSITVYDQSGASHVLTVTFTHTGDNGIWEWEASLDGEQRILNGSRGQLLFNTDGTPATWTFHDQSSSFSFDPANGSHIVDIRFDYGTPGLTNGITQFSAPTTIAASDQDGYATGNLINISINERGQMRGAFTNGTERMLAQIYLARFTNSAGLTRSGDNIFSESSNSGSPIMGIPGVSDASVVRSGSLEKSNVDIATEFTSMIKTQRGFQASSRVVSTSDQLLQELVNLIR